MIGKCLWVVVGCLVLAMSVGAATFTVVSNLDNGNPGTLRWAINSANANLGPDVINFSILPPGPYTIAVIGQLPALTDMTGVLIDGLTQPGGATQGTNPPSTLNLLITLNGAQAGPACGLLVKSNNNRIQGLVIEEFMQDGILIEGGPYEANANQIFWNILGLDRTGTVVRGNGTNLASLWGGVRCANNVQFPPAIVTANQIVQNLISGNYAEGVAIWGAQLPGDVAGNIVDHNFIGTDITGLLDRGNRHEGVCLTEGTHHNGVSGNLISGNDFDGIGIQGYNNQPSGIPIQTHSNTVVGNTIGLDKNLNPLPNSMVGISIGAYGQQHFGCADRNVIGPGNVIARNGGHGVMVWEDAVNNSNGDQNQITQNSHYDNGGLGIDLQDDGVTANDPGDQDARANQQSNFPVIDSAVYSGGNTTIYGTLSIDTDPMQATVEVFKAALDPTGYGEGKTYLVSTNPTSATGSWSVTVATLVAGDTVTATAADLNKNTSEFSASVGVRKFAVPWDCTLNPPPGKTGGGMEIEPNDACQAAIHAVCEAAYCGAIAGPQDIDWWTITLPSDTCYCLHVRVLANATPGQFAFGGGLDPTLTIYAADCATQLFFNDNHLGIFPDAVGTDAQYDCQDQGNCYPRGTTLYIKVASSLQSIAGGPYLLILNCDRCTCPQAQYDTCTYYKKAYVDYCPNGMPDFDQKQNHWWTGMPPSVQWSHCGPVALANCLWWFDSKFESSPVDPRPFYPSPLMHPKNDHYRLVTSYDGQGVWDDHDTNNVRPLVDSLALYAQTNVGTSGTDVANLATAAQNWINKAGLSSDYTVRLVPMSVYPFDSIRAEVLASQDVILLLGFYQESAPGYCERIGGHYVTVAGTCTDPTARALCISDPFFDDNEGGAVHPSTDHNDASLVSGPHGTIHHDRYDLMPTVCQPHPPNLPFPLELVNYPINAGNVTSFYGENGYQPWVPVVPTGAPLHTVPEFAIIICPVDTCANQLPGDVDVNGVIDDADTLRLHNILESGGGLPDPASNADPNGDCVINYQDVIFLVNYLHHSGAAPVKCTCIKPHLTCCVGLTGNVDMDPANSVDISDLTAMIDYLYITFTPLICPEEANCDGDATGAVDISDLTWLIDYLYVSFTPVAHCR